MFSVEEAIKWDEKGWIIGSSIYSREIFMKWIHEYLPPSYEYLIEQENIRAQNTVEQKRSVPSSAYFEAIKRWPLKEKND